MRLGSVPYLNARPLVDWLERQEHAEVTLSYAAPSMLIAQLLAGELELAMASTYALLTHPELCLMPGIGVTVSGAAWSVRLLSRCPAEIRTLALDATSRSTNMLGRIILADGYGIHPICREMPPERDAMLAQADAAVLIGDIGLTVSGDGLFDLDLGEEWWKLTGLPFYFAGWMARDPGVIANASPLLSKACAQGLARLPEIATEEAARLHIPRERCYRYLYEVMRYQTGAAEEAGLREFFSRAARLQAMP